MPGQRYIGILAVVMFMLMPQWVLAEEGGSGHYFPGSMASFMDGVSPTPTLIFRLNVIDYEGSFDGDVPVPIAGLAALDVDVDSSAVGLTAFWRPSFEMGENWSYAVSMTVPYVDLTVEADVAVPIDPMGRTVRRSDSASGLGDILFFPVMLNYTFSPALSANFRLGFYAPTGDYEVGALANTGKNFWTVEPTAALMYLSPESGVEASVFFGIDFNEKNEDTDYKSGNQAHIEATVAQHFPLWGGGASAGITGFWYQQITGDSGSGAAYGDFKARALGIGPVVSLSRKLDNADLIAEFKWLHESGVERRAEGDTLFLKVMLKF
ncbi:MAG: transporter [Halioglobus sp.]